MKALNRYICVLFAGFLIIFTFFTLLREKYENAEQYSPSESFLEATGDIFASLSFETEVDEFEISKCTMSRCFNLSQCLSQPDFKVYVYPTSNFSAVSVLYSNILKILRESFYYTDDYRSACLFVLGIDTTDRDRRSENFVRQVNDLVRGLPAEIWNDGRNHIIFNLYHGTYPDYSDHDLGFNIGYAMVARASANAEVFRRNFDLSFPLFHPKHPLRTVIENVWPLNLEDRHLVTFKGKRYVYGIGSETRDSLYHLHNGKTSIMVTTCKHNTDWKKYEDERCEQDNIEFEKWDYEGIMSNSTFCLTPRGRRLGSFRFLESLRLGCIPVVLSDDWVLPFAEIIDWSQAAVIAHEDSVLTITDALNAIPLSRILHMKQQARGLYQRYFNSVERIVLTSVEIVRERLRKQNGIFGRQWDMETFRIVPANQYPVSGGCTAIIQTGNKLSSTFLRHIHVLSSLPFISKILVFWPSIRGVLPENTSTPNGKPVNFIQLSAPDQLAMFLAAYFNYYQLQGDFLLLLDERLNLSKEYLLNMYDVARLDPSHLTGAYAAVHKRKMDIWEIDFNTAVEHSMILPHLVLFRKDFIPLLWQWIPRPALKIAEKIPQCFTVLLNFMLAERLYKPPTFISGRKMEPWITSRNYTLCLNALVKEVWSTGPLLIRSRTRIESVLSL